MRTEEFHALTKELGETDTAHQRGLPEERLLYLLEETLEIYPQQAALLEQIVKGPLLNAD